MKVGCTNNISSVLPIYLQSSYSFKDAPTILESIEAGKEYVVYTLAEHEDCLGYYFCDRDSDVYPFWYPHHFFEVIDSSISRYWVYNLRKTEQKEQIFLSFPEWSKDIYFYNNLIDGEEQEMALFAKYKELMDLEFPNKSITEIAQIGDDKWLICPDCIDAWEYDDDRSAMVRCPLCKTVYHNPRYRPNFTSSTSLGFYKS